MLSMLLLLLPRLLLQLLVDCLHHMSCGRLRHQPGQQGLVWEVLGVNVVAPPASLRRP